jgi:hypothetical protein
MADGIELCMDTPTASIARSNTSLFVSVKDGMDLAEAFEWYADWAADVSPLYEQLAQGIAEDSSLLDIAAEAANDQPPPQLFLGAVHALLLRGDDHSLVDFYPTCTENSAEGDPFPTFRDFCLVNDDEIRAIVSSRRVQTNEIGRSAVLLPAFEYVARSMDCVPLALIEIGTSAGLNLYWDRYRYEYEGYGTYGDPDSPAQITSAVRGDRDPPFPERPSEVSHRVGIDLNPLDVTDGDDAQWLQALVIPDQKRRHEQLRTAIDVVRDDPPDLVRGDAFHVLPDLLADVPDDTALCVFSTHTLYQLDDDTITKLRDLLTEFSNERPVHWLSDDPFSEFDHPTYRYIVLSDGTPEETQLAEYASYGEWIRWLTDDGT